MTSQTSLSASRAFLAATLFTLVAAVANADPVSTADVPSVTVSYGDLDVSTVEGNKVLYRRIVAAAEKVCPTSSAPGARFSSPHRSCVNAAIERAVSDSKSAQLAEVHAASGRHMARS